MKRIVVIVAIIVFALLVWKSMPICEHCCGKGSRYGNPQSDQIEGINFPMGRAHWKLGYKWQNKNYPIKTTCGKGAT